MMMKKVLRPTHRIDIVANPAINSAILSL